MEYILWGIVPAGVALSAVVVSVKSALRHPRLIQSVLTVVALAGAAWALWVLKRIVMEGAWPTILAHLAIVVVAIVARTQAWLAHRHSSDRHAA